MPKLKPFTSGDKRIFNALSRAMISADIQAKVIKPDYEKMTGKLYPEKNTYLDVFFEKDPEAKRAWGQLQRTIKRMYSEYSREISQEKNNG